MTSAVRAQGHRVAAAERDLRGVGLRGRRRGGEKSQNDGNRDERDH
jgi:hypothetical protein